MTVGVPDAPEPDEVVVIVAAANRGRPNFRLGGLKFEDLQGKTGSARPTSGTEGQAMTTATSTGTRITHPESTTAG
jgi:hypothetical protein